MKEQVKDKEIQIKHNDDQVIQYKIKELDSKYIRNIVKNNKAIRFKLKLFNVDKLTPQVIEESRDIMLVSYKESKILKDSIDIMWHTQCERSLEILRKYPDRDELELQVDFKQPEFTLITSLWDSKKDEHPILGDELYEVYKQNRDKEEEGIEMNSFDKDGSLVKCIEYITTTQEKVKQLETMLLEKEAQIEQLKKGNDVILYFKECKKQIITTNNNVEACIKLINKQESHFNKKIETIENSFLELTQQLKQTQGGVSQKDLNALNDNLIKGVQQVKEEIRKDIKEALLHKEEKEKEVVENTTATKYEDKIKDKEGKEVEDELADILKGLKL